MLRILSAVRRNSRSSVRVPRVAVRLIDQAAWSAGFFGFNLAASSVLGLADFAMLSVATAVGFIFVASLRAWEVNSRVVAGSVANLAPNLAMNERSAAFSAGALSLVTVVVLYIWFTLEQSDSQWWRLGLVGALIVASDLPRQILVMRSLYNVSLAISLVYGAAGGVALFLTTGSIDENQLLDVWLFALLVVSIVGWCSLKWQGAYHQIVSHGAYRWRMSAEAAYLGLGSQFSVLVLFLISDDEATAGIRLCYVLVYAPAFMIIQGLQPLILKRVADINSVASSRKSIHRTVALWQVFIIGIVSACGFAATLIGLIHPDTSISSAVTYVIPVGVAVVGSQIFDSTMLEMRFRVKPSTVHTTRLWMVLIEVSLMSAAAIGWHASGVLTAMVVGGLSKLFYSGAMSRAVANRRKNDENLPSSFRAGITR